MTPAVSFALGAIGKLWAAPWSLAGLVLGAAGLAAGARVRIACNAIWFTGYPLGAGALTLGNVVLATRGWEPEAVREAYGVVQPVGAHERAHTLQYQMLGPCFPLAYLLAPGAFTARSPFERAATRHATGSGSWWPWMRGGRITASRAALDDR